jgi:sugar phosphate permease
MGGMSQAKWAKKKAKEQKRKEQDKMDKVQFIPKGILKNKVVDS